MEKIICNELTHDGMRRVKIIGDAVINETRYQDLLPLEALDRVLYAPGRDDQLGLFSLEMKFPVDGPWEVFYYGPKGFRRFMFVNFQYAECVSSCVEIARNEFFIRTHFTPRDAYVAKLPEDVEIWTDVHGCILQVAEWMPAQCVAVGGLDV